MLQAREMHAGFLLGPWDSELTIAKAPFSGEPNGAFADD